MFGQLAAPVDASFDCIVLEMGNALPWLSDCQRKTGTPANDYSENAAFRYQETVIKFQPRTDQSAFISPKDPAEPLHSFTEVMPSRT
uniref:Uncharacterized protein n=1 Tax=Sphaerodactylus townsendi TaxID=933632 RepID=A0ACB8F8J1_9SAUR